MLGGYKSKYKMYNAYGFRPNAPDDRIAIAYFYVPAVNNRGLDGFIEGIKELAQQQSFSLFMGGEYSILRAYAYLNDRVGFTAYYRENCQRIWERIHNIMFLYPKNELFHMAEYIFRLEED